MSIKIKNKRGQVAELAFILATLAVIAQALFVASTHQTYVAGSVGDLTESTDFYSKLDKFDLLNRESARLAVQQAYAKTLERPAMAGNCQTIIHEGKPIPLLNGSCSPDNEKIKSDFINAVSSEFSDITLKKKFDIKFERGKILFRPSEVYSTVFVLGKAVSYNITHQFNSPFDVGYPDLDISGLTAMLLSKRSSCISEGKRSASCMSSLKLNGWTIYAEEGQYLIARLKSEKSYLSLGAFKPAEIVFAMQKLS